VQISTSKVRPSDSQTIPAFPSYAQGIVAWGTTVSRASRAKPTWVRVGNKAGKWTPWVATGPALTLTRHRR